MGTFLIVSTLRILSPVNTGVALGGVIEAQTMEPWLEENSKQALSALPSTREEDLTINHRDDDAIITQNSELVAIQIQ